MPEAPTWTAHTHTAAIRGPRIALSALQTLLLLLALAALPAHARVVSKTVYFLQPDGRSYLLERTLRSPATSHRFYVDKSVTRDDLRHVEPKEFTWDEQAGEDLNMLQFDSDGFGLIFPGRFADERLSVNARGEVTYTSWDGTRNAAGRYGIWYSPDDFDDFSYTWILPDNIELLAYKANREGDWVRRGNAVSFYAHDVNNLTFEIRYRVTNVAASAPADCPQPPAAAAPLACADPEPAAVTLSSPGGCSQDCDGDGVSNAADHCPASAAGATVDRRGCVLGDGRDSDADGVADGRDLCPASAPGARVDRAGCSLDTDKDGIADGTDRCPATAEGAAVDQSGCAG